MPRLFFVSILLLGLFQGAPQSQIRLYDGEEWRFFETTSTNLAEICALGPRDVAALLGKKLPNDSQLPLGGVYTLQVWRAQTVRLQQPGNAQDVQSAGQTVGEILQEQGIIPSAADLVHPPLETPVSQGMVITYQPAQRITIQADGKSIHAKSSAGTVGAALAQAGIPLIGLDTSLPAESEPLPPQGVIRVIRVYETLSLDQKPLPFQTDYVDSPEVEFGLESIVHPGLPGLAVRRTRARYADGQLISTTEEAETVIIAPQNRVSARGTKIVLHTLEIPGGSVKYWRAIQMYATSYSPCRSGGSKCSYGTASGLPVQRGVVAMSIPWYRQLAGVRVYIPGYGVATVGDTGGGFPDGRAWIDLAYTDADYQGWSQWVTVYFLEPAPAEIPYILK